MAEENVTGVTGSPRLIASIRRTLDAFNRGDFDSAVELAAPDIEVVARGGSANLRGADEFRAFMEPETMEDVSIELEDFQLAGDNLLVHLHTRGRGAASGITVEMRFWSVWTFNDAGLVTRFVMFRPEEEAEARLAAGLAE